MKRTAAFSAMFLLSVLTFAQPAPSRRFANPLLNDVVQMTRADLSDATIVAYVKARRARLDSDLSADDLIQLRRAGVSEAVVRYIAGATGIADDSGARAGDVAYDSTDEPADSVEPVYDVGLGDPYWYAYGYPYWYAYSPYFTTSFFIGGGRFHGRGFVHHRSGPGHHPFGHAGGRGGSHSSGGHGRR